MPTPFRIGVTLGLAALVLAGGAFAINYTVEQHVRAGLDDPLNYAPNSTVTYGDVSVDILKNTIFVDGMSITNDAGETAIAALEMAVDGFLFFLPSPKLIDVTASDITAVDKETSMEFDASRFHVAGLVLEELSEKGMNGILNFDTWSISGITSSNTDLSISVDHAAMNTMVDGQLQEMIFSGLDVSFAELPAGTESATGSVSIAEARYGNLNLKPLITVIAEQANPLPEDQILDALIALELDAFSASDLEVIIDGFGRYSYGKVLLGLTDYVGGAPLSGSLEMLDSVTELEPGAAAALAGAQNLPVFLQYPDRSEGEMSLRYEISEDGILSAGFSLEDTFFDIRIENAIEVVGFRPLREALTAGTPVADLDLAPGLGLASLNLDMDSLTTWDPPRVVDGKPTIRMFLSFFLADGQFPPDLQTQYIDPIKTFLASGGSLNLTVAPDEPITQEVVSGLAVVPPHQALPMLGVSITGE